MWRDMNKLTGNASFRHDLQLKSDGSFTSDPLPISDILAKHASVSSNVNYDSTFLSHEVIAEHSRICFGLPSGEPLPYNLPMTEELSIVINENLKNASPCRDDI